MANGIIAIVTDYLLGSIPSAYIATRLTTGKDIRQLGKGIYYYPNRLITAMTLP